MRRQIGRAVLVILAGVLAILLVGSLLVPVPQLAGALPLQALADAEASSARSMDRMSM